MNRLTAARTILLIAIIMMSAVTAMANEDSPATVKITPLGSQDGEFCRYDRALILEDPNGTRLLYDAGRTVRGGDDPRLGEIDAVLLSHVHGDHLGDVYQPTANAGSCASPDFSVSATPESNTVRIAVAKQAKLLVGGEMPGFFENKVAAAGGSEKQVQLLRFGGEAEVAGVKIASVPAVHSNGLGPVFIEGQVGEMLAVSGLTAYVGPPGGYVVSFSNGLVVYLSGDTGVTAEQDLVVRQLYGAELAVINIGGTFTTGPSEAAYVIGEMVQPNAVIPSHANEEATRDGELLPGTRTATFAEAVSVPVYLPLSGRTLAFDDQGRCVGGCQGRR